MHLCSMSGRWLQKNLTTWALLQGVWRELSEGDSVVGLDMPGHRNWRHGWAAGKVSKLQMHLTV